MYSGKRVFAQVMYHLPIDTLGQSVRRWVRLFFVVSHPAAPDPRMDETSILCRP